MAEETSFETIVSELREREPLFHQPDLCSTREQLEAYAAPEFWEVGASGKVYDREDVISTVEARFRDQSEADTSNWKIGDFSVLQIGPITFLARYTLDQDGRLSRRSTIWRKTANSWQVVFHQGTLIEQ